MMMSNAMEINESNYQQEVEASSAPVLIDFWAAWCGPCRMLAPTVDQLAADYAGRVKVGKIDVDHNQSLAARFGIQGIPTLLIVKAGKPVARIVGVRPKADIAKELDAVLAAK
jgi:thioredoxin 1